MDSVITLASQSQGGSDPKILTMIYVIDNAAPQSVLLGYKTRGFGKGKWNGFGGKVEPTDPSIVAAAVRELEEESGLSARVESMRRVGVNFYRYPDALEKRLFECHIYIVRKEDVTGACTTSEEMNPIEYVPFGGIPLDHMWVDDPHWLPQLLELLTLGGDKICFAGFFEFESFEKLSSTKPPVVVWGSDAELLTATRGDR
jgi:8-oxo-dGTP pyrophosphatase MutT (NUDIX family)